MGTIPGLGIPRALLTVPRLLVSFLAFVPGLLETYDRTANIWEGIIAVPLVFLELAMLCIYAFCLITKALVVSNKTWRPSDWGWLGEKVSTWLDVVGTALNYLTPYLDQLLML